MTINTDELKWAVDDVNLPGTGAANKSEPSTTIKTVGLDYQEFLAAEDLNWMFSKIYSAIVDLDSRTISAGQLPVGSIYMNEDDDRNPAILLGYGTWESKSGTVIIGAGTYTDSNNETKTFIAGTEGGEYSHKLTISELPAHTHGNVPLYKPTGDVDRGTNTSKFSIDDVDKTASTGSDQPHNNMMPYTVAYVWKRIA